jgi:hypothetical protein
MELEGWSKILCPAWVAAKANVAELEKLREAQAQLQMRGIVADASAAQFPLLTAKMTPKDVSSLKKSFPRQAFVKEIEAFEGEGKKFATEFSSKQAASPSAAWKMLMAARPEAVLWAAYSARNAAVQAKFKSFYTDWPQARQKIPYTQMQEMRIVPGIPGYDELVEKLFFQLMDGKLTTPEEIKAFLEPYSPPAPPPPVHLRRARATKKEPKVPKSRKKAAVEEGRAEASEALEEVASVGETAAAVAPASVPKAGKAAAPKPAEGKTAIATKVAAPAKAAAKPPASAKAPAKKAPPAKTAAKKAIAKKSAAKPAAKKASPAKAVKKGAVKKAPAKSGTSAAKKIPGAKAKGRSTLGARPVAKAVSRASAKASPKPQPKGKAKKKR